MSTKNAGALSSTDTEDNAETIEIPVEEYEQLKEENEKLREELSDYREKNEQDKAEIRGDLHRLKEAVKPAIGMAEREKMGEEESQTEETTSTREKTPLERVIDDPDTSGVRVTASVQRAMTIAGHFREWSEKAQAGRVIRGGLKKLLGAATDERLAWRQIYRACEKLEDLTNGAMKFKKSNRHGWMIVLDDGHLLSNVVSGG